MKTIFYSHATTQRGKLVLEAVYPCLFRLALSLLHRDPHRSYKVLQRFAARAASDSAPSAQGGSRSNHRTMSLPLFSPVSSPLLASFHSLLNIPNLHAIPWHTTNTSKVDVNVTINCIYRCSFSPLALRGGLLCHESEVWLWKCLTSKIITTSVNVVPLIEIKRSHAHL